MTAIPATATPVAVDLPGLAELTADLTRAAHVPGTLVVIDGDLTDGQAYTHTDTCTRAPQITLAADLLTGGPYPLYGALAHEIAHRALGHLSPRRPWRWASEAAALAAIAAVLTGYPWGLAVAATVVMAAAHLLDAYRQRAEEMEADAHSVELLNAAGLPGRDVVAATLAQLPADGWWYRTVGWIGGGRPTVAARRRALDRRHGCAR